MTSSFPGCLKKIVAGALDSILRKKRFSLGGPKFRYLKSNGTPDRLAAATRALQCAADGQWKSV
jgi:hypothetical protein